MNVPERAITVRPTMSYISLAILSAHMDVILIHKAAGQYTVLVMTFQKLLYIKDEVRQKRHRISLVEYRRLSVI